MKSSENGRSDEPEERHKQKDTNTHKKPENSPISSALRLHYLNLFILSYLMYLINIHFRFSQHVIVICTDLS